VSLTLAPDARASGRFGGTEEALYHLRKFDELRRYTLRTLLTLPPLILGLWVWDWAIDPLAAPRTLGLRVGMAACLLPLIGVVRSGRVGPRGYTVLLYGSVLSTQVFWLAILLRLQQGLEYGIGGYMYYVLGMLVVGLPLRFWDNVIGLSVSLLTPNLIALAGLLPDFSYARYNTLILPAGALSLFTLWAFDRLYRRTFSYQRDIEHQAAEDALTGIANRRQFMTVGKRLFEEFRRYQRPAGVLLIDLDHFKSVNDRHGHAAGDTVLQATARLLDELRRVPDLPARLGGEEFALLLPETDPAGAVAIAERLRAGLERLQISVPGPPETVVTMTMSVGVAVCVPGDQSLDAVLRRADHALYRAKDAGRNRVEQ
jgi:diguanylate cyclase (GGDEF)-like protein